MSSPSFLLHFTITVVQKRNTHCNTQSTQRRTHEGHGDSPEGSSPCTRSEGCPDQQRWHQQNAPHSCVRAASACRLSAPCNHPHSNNLHLDTHRAPMTLQDVAFAYHVTFLALFGKIWSWHWTPAAANLPGAQGFGFFFRYLTFCSFTLQVIQLIFCVAARLPKVGRVWVHTRPCIHSFEITE